MRRRIYWLLPDLESAKRTMDDLLLARIGEQHMHFVAREGADMTGLHAANVLLWRRIVVAAGNVAYLLAFNTLVAHAYAIAPVPAAHRTDELLDTGGHLQLAEFIANGYSDDAERLARHLLSCSAAAAAQEVRAVEGKG